VLSAGPARSGGEGGAPVAGGEAGERAEGEAPLVAAGLTEFTRVNTGFLNRFL